MAAYAVEAIRTVALVGHGGSGKTSLAEQAFFLAGATKRLGRVDQKNAVLDSDPEEQERGHSIDAAVGSLEWPHPSGGKALIQIVDAPGYPDFFGAAVGALLAADIALLVINATAGIEVNTRKMWTAAREHGLACGIVFNRMDGENVDFEGLLSQVKEVLGAPAAPFVLPVVSGGFQGVVGVASPSGEAPAGAVGDVAAARQALVEAIVETDEALMERYLAEETIGAEEFASACRKAIAGGAVAPVFCTSAPSGAGVKELLDALVAFFPSPADAAPKTARSGQEEVGVRPDPAGPLVAQVFRLVTDPFVGRMSYVRVRSGTLKPDTVVQAGAGGRGEKVGQVLRPFGKETQSVPSAGPGEVVVIPKLEHVALFDTLCDGAALDLGRPALPHPMVSLALEPKSRADEQRLSQSLDKLCQEDPTFKVTRDPQTHELVVSGMSTLHLDIVLRRLKRRFGVEVTTKEPKVPYRETISVKGEAMHRHKKQTGGRGQFGEVWIRLEPLERGAGFEFLDEIVGGAIPGQYIPSVEKGIRETMEKGILAGCPVVDVRVRLYDGKFHPVDSSDAAFKIAGSMAFRKGFLECKPVLLEPVVTMEITIPSQNMGDISGDIVARRGRIIGMESLGDMQVVRAQAPLAEVSRYATELRSITGGQGYYTMEFSHYDVVPAHIAEGVIAAAKRGQEEEA